MLSSTPGKKLNRYVPDYVIFDLETTGVSSQSDAVVEISAIKVQNGKVIEKAKANGVKICPKCGQVMKKRNGKFGEFWGCAGYPNCRYTQNI